MSDGTPGFDWGEPERPADPAAAQFQQSVPGGRTVVIAAIGVVLGVAILVAKLVGSSPQPTGNSAYDAGSRVGDIAGWGVAVLLLTAGAFTLTNAWRMQYGHNALPSPARWQAALLAVALGAVISALVLATKGGNGTATGYPEDIQAAFTAGCEHGGGSTVLCGCMLSYTEAHVTLSDYQAGGLAVEQGRPHPPWMQAAALVCENTGP